MSNHQPPRSGKEGTEGGFPTLQKPQHDTTLNSNATNGNATNNEQAQDTANGPTLTTVIEIVFENSNAEAMNFKMKKATPSKKAMDVYCSRVGLQRRVLRFLFDGQRVLDESTPTSLEMEHGDKIEVHTEQIGGHAAWFDGSGKMVTHPH